MSTTIFNQTIRGMTNVSQLATKKFYNRTALEVAQIYFPQSTQKKVKNMVILKQYFCHLEFKLKYKRKIQSRYIKFVKSKE